MGIENYYCPLCGSLMESVLETFSSLTNITEVLEWGCPNSECPKSLHYESKYVRKNKELFNFNNYKKFRRKLLKK